MKITVAMRIIGGFLTISLLLIIISVSSLINLNSVGSAVDEVKNVAVPTLSGSNALKGSFLTMSRVTFEAYIEEDLNGLEEKYQSFKESDADFNSQYSRLDTILQDDATMQQSLTNTKKAYDKYVENVEAVYSNHRQYMEIRNKIQDTLGSIEESADDASMYLLDFSDSDAVASNPSLQQAAKVGGDLETALLSLITVSSEFTKTQRIIRAEVIGNEVQLIVQNIQELTEKMNTAAGETDTTGAVSEVNALVQDAVQSVTGSDGLLALQRTRLNYRNSAEQALVRSDEFGEQGVKTLESLLKQADDKATAIDKQVTSKVSSGNIIVIIVAIVSLILAIIIGYWTVLAITRPLNRVNQLLNVASSGDLTHRLDDSSDDEFGELAANCNKLISNLKALI